MKITASKLKKIIREQVEESTSKARQHKTKSSKEVSQMNADIDRLRGERLAGLKKELKAKHSKAFKFVVSRFGMEAIDKLIEDGEYAAGMNGGYGYTYSDARLDLFRLVEEALPG